MPFARTPRPPAPALAVAAALLVWSARTSARAADAPTPAAAASSADVQALIDEKNYSGAVSAVSRLVTKSGSAAADLDKAQLYALKGEAHLHLKQSTQAADAFTRASKAATDPTTAATDAALALLAKRSPSGTYKPKQPGPDGAKPAPVDLTAGGDHKDAMGYLFADEFAGAGSKLKAAKTATSVPQLMQAADTALSLRQLEVAATGADEKTKPEVAAVAEHAHGLLETSLRLMAQRVADIRQAASATSTTYRQQRQPNGAYLNVPVVTKAGLSSSNVSELRNVQDTCGKIGPAAQAFAKVSADAGGDGGSAGWDAVVADATRTGSQAGDALNTDYGNGVSRGR